MRLLPIISLGILCGLSRAQARHLGSVNVHDPDANDPELKTFVAYTHQQSGVNMWDLAYLAFQN